MSLQIDSDSLSSNVDFIGRQQTKRNKKKKGGTNDARKKWLRSRVTRQMLREMAADVAANGSLVKLQAAEYAQKAKLVRNTALRDCSASKQYFAVITCSASVNAFRTHQALYVAAAGEMHQPGVDNEDPLVLMIVCLRTNRYVKASELSVACKHICLVLSSFRFKRPVSTGCCAGVHQRRCWPLHDPGFNVAMMLHATSRSDRCAKLSCGVCQCQPGHFGSEAHDSWLRGISGHFGIDVAEYFAYMVHYTSCLWFLGCFGFVFTVLRACIIEEKYEKVRPFFSIVLLVFCASVVEQDDETLEELKGAEKEETRDRGAWSEEIGSHRRTGMNQHCAWHEPESPSVAFSCSDSRVLVDNQDSTSGVLHEAKARRNSKNRVADVAEELLGIAEDAFNFGAMITREVGGMAKEAFIEAQDMHKVANEIKDMADGFVRRASELHPRLSRDDLNAQTQIMEGARTQSSLTEDDAAWLLRHSMKGVWRGVHRAEQASWVRWAKTAMLLPMMALYCLAVTAVFVGLFWFEMWVIFEWGECSRINAENGNEDCLSPVSHRGEFIGWLVEICPSVSEGILLELLMSVAKAMSAFVSDQQNWSTQEQYDFAFFIQSVLFECVGKVGFVMVLALLFVPQWEDAATSCEGNLDERIFGERALSCIKIKTSYNLRLTLFERSMKGPMLVSMLVAMLVKVLLPQLISELVVRAERVSTRSSKGVGSSICRCICTACCCCWTGFWKIAGLIFLFDCGVVGGPLVLIKPLRAPLVPARALKKRESSFSPDSSSSSDESPTSKAALSWQSHVDQEPLAQSFGVQSIYAVPKLASTNISLEHAFFQGVRREFCVLDEYLEVLLHFTFFSFFGMVWPLGCSFALMNYLLEFRFDVFKLGYVRRRALPSVNPSLRRLVHAATLTICYASIVVQVVLMLLPFRLLVVWSPNDYEGRRLTDYVLDLLIVGVLLVLFLLCLSWLIRASVERLTRWRRNRRVTLEHAEGSEADARDFSDSHQLDPKCSSTTLACESVT